MATILPTAQDWKNCGLVPTSGLYAWHMFEEGVSANGAANDYSGNNRHLTTSSSKSVLTMDAINGQPAWYFDGARNPMLWDATVAFKHFFILCSADEATFGGYRGLFSDKTTASWLVGLDTDTKFFDFSGVFANSYFKTDVAYANNDQQAPMSGAFALVEVQIPGGVIGDAFQIGKQTSLSRFWKGYFAEMLVYSSVLSQIDRERVRLYFNLKFAQYKVGLPFYFPSDDLMQFKRSRFYAQPVDWTKITDSFEFEDGSRTFNEVASNAPRHWEYDYLGRTPQEVVIFDAFWNQARMANQFTFRDKYGNEWANTNIEGYNRSHDDHKSWSNDVKFKLIKYP